MSDLQIPVIVLLIPVAFFLGLYACAILSRINGPEETDEYDPPIERLDVRAIINKHSED